MRSWAVAIDDLMVPLASLAAEAEWRRWAFEEFLACTGSATPEEACVVLAEFGGRVVLADPFIYNVGGVYGVTVLAYEAGTARGLGDLRLAALASGYLCDPHGLGVAKYVEGARRVATMRDPLWRTL